MQAKALGDSELRSYWEVGEGIDGLCFQGDCGLARQGPEGPNEAGRSAGLGVETMVASNQLVEAGRLTDGPRRLHVGEAGGQHSLCDLTQRGLIRLGIVAGLAGEAFKEGVHNATLLHLRLCGVISFVCTFTLWHKVTFRRGDSPRFPGNPTCCPPPVAF